MKLLCITSIALALAQAAYADRPLIVDNLTCFKDTKDCTPHSVPDAGGTLGLLGLGMASLAFWRIKLA
jgi:hypothetical protein